MKQITSIILIAMMATLVTSCSNFNGSLSSASSLNASGHPLKSKKDILIERILTTGLWKYQRQGDDCEDTRWEQRFYKNRYYQSVGSACLLVNAFSVEAESWHVKAQNLYIVNLSTSDADDIILKYSIDYLDSGKLVLSSKGYKYTFLK